MELGSTFIPFSSIGYFFASTVLIISSTWFYGKWKVNKLESTEYLLKAMVWLAPAHFLWGFPAIVTTDPYILGLVSVPANIFLMFFHAYFGRFAFALSGKYELGKRFFNYLLVWTALISLPINFIYLPQPFIDANGVEVWAYTWQLFFSISVWTPITVAMVAYVLLKNFKKSKDKVVTALLSISFIIGGVSANFVVLSDSSLWLYFAGYVAMFMGAYWVLLLPFSFHRE